MNEIGAIDADVIKLIINYDNVTRYACQDRMSQN